MQQDDVTRPLTEQVLETGEVQYSIEVGTGRFVYATDEESCVSGVPRPFATSTGKKWPYRGTFYPLKGSVRGVPAVAVFYSRDNLSCAMCESFGLGRASSRGAGPRAFASGAFRRPDMPEVGLLPAVIEEDAGVSLRAAMAGAVIPGVNPTMLLAAGTEGGALQTAKIELDLAVQLQRLHGGEQVQTHGDIKAANICLRSIGSQPWDIRATIIDFDLHMEGDGDTRYSGRTPAYFDLLFEEKPVVAHPAPQAPPTRIECDLGCLALVFCELENRKQVEELSKDELSPNLSGPMFSYGPQGEIEAGGIGADTHIAPLASRLHLRTFGEYVEADGRLLARKPQWMSDSDYVDKLALSELRGEYMDNYIQQEEIIARKIFENYNAHLVADGEAVKYPDFDSQPTSFIKSNCDQALSYVMQITMLDYDLVALETCAPEDRASEFSPEEIELLASREHDRWIAEREADGWKYGETLDGRGDAERKISPYLVPYDELSEEIKEYDRQPMREMIGLLESAGFAVVKRG